MQMTAGEIAFNRSHQTLEGLKQLAKSRLNKYLANEAQAQKMVGGLAQAQNTKTQQNQSAPRSKQSRVTTQPHSPPRNVPVKMPSNSQPQH